MKTLEDILESFGRSHVVVIGDVMVDKFVYGDVSRISPEAPALVLSASREVETLGGAANVAKNITSLGAECTCIGLIGDDNYGSYIRTSLFPGARIGDGLVTDVNRCSTVKIRYVSPHHNTHLLRADWESSKPASLEIEDLIIKSFTDLSSKASIVVLSDYNKGVLTPKICQSVIEHAVSRKIPVVVDPKGRNYEKYRGATVITPNLMELSTYFGCHIPQDESQISERSLSLIETLDIQGVVVKRSEFGAQYVSRREDNWAVSATARKVIDVSGAGDTFVSSLALAIAAGGSFKEALRVANSAGGLVVELEGTSTISLDDLRDALIPRPSAHMPDKIASNDMEVKMAVSAWRAEGLVVGFANGCFDLLHPGHVRLLSAARSRVDRLIVALNSDESVSRLKGKDRPIQTQEARLAVMAAIGSVDLVTLFPEDTPYNLIKLIVPDVIFKGSDYKVEDVVGADLVREAGGRVELIDLIPNSSTTSIVDRMATR